METSPHTRGERRALLAAIRRGRKHPRIRGENPTRLNRDLSGMETSPHTRGEQQTRRYCEERTRNIPAYAGRTHCLNHRNSQSRKHPRIRGENNCDTVSAESTRETSPHTRGELKLYAPCHIGVGNIPAYAGRTTKGEA